MADSTIKRGDTWPPLRGRASDGTGGTIDLTAAGTILFLAKSGATLITGNVAVINPPDVDGFNWSYTWGSGDTDIPGDYSVELEVHWDATKIETIPNAGHQTLTIEQDQG